MSTPSRHQSDAARPLIVLTLLESVGRSATVSQQGITAELGMAPGPGNAGLKRRIKNGLVEVGEPPALPHVTANRIAQLPVGQSFELFKLESPAPRSRYRPQTRIA